MEHPRADINKEVLAWARDAAGYSLEEAARKIGIRTERYTAWEDVEDELLPTIKQLRKTAQVFHRPVSVFYLPEPPTTFQAMRDLRRLPGDGIRTFSPALRYEMELAQQRRELALELYGEIGEQISELTTSISLSDDPEEAGHSVREMLRVTFANQVEWGHQGGLATFHGWRQLLEGIDILVFQMSRVDWDEVSGFAVAETRLPVIAVNRRDAPSRRTFSLLHEFAHILMRMSGASDLEIDASRPPEEEKIEIFCNRVAAATLVPERQLLDLDIVKSHPGRSTAWTDDSLRTGARFFGVSREAFLRRLLTYGRTTNSFYLEKRKQFIEEFTVSRELKRKSYKESEREFRRNPAQDTFLELGKPFVRLVMDSIRQDIITLNEASGYLGNLRIRHFDKLEQRAH